MRPHDSPIYKKVKKFNFIEDIWKKQNLTEGDSFEPYLDQG
jgi:hypothetical protein